jgi:arylformamidase
MELVTNINSKQFRVDHLNPLDISIPLLFNGNQPNTYNVPIASSKAYEDGTFIGDTRRGGACNFEEYKLIAHCNGTHTECVGHITNERYSIQKILQEAFIPSTLITVQPEKGSATSDSYIPEKASDDLMITKKSLEQVLNRSSLEWREGLIIRTLPNEESKKSREYMEHAPPFFSLQAMQYLNELGIKHLLVDFPSLDRTFDEGKLSTHHIFWNMKPESHEVKGSPSVKTVTEMVYVLENIADGNYLLNLQIAPFVSDAAPSRPILFKVSEI